MARLTNELKDLIVDRVGRFNVDILLGWEAGAQGKERIGRRLFDRIPPSHFEGNRRDDWYAGHRAGLAERDRAVNRRTVVFAGRNKDGSVVITRKGWTVKRSIVVTQMERRGCFGLVLVNYFEGSKIVRTINCGI